MELSYLITAVGWFIGGFINIISGMGGPMVALPIMVLFMDFTLVALVAVLLACLTNLILIWRYWRYTDWRATLLLTLGSAPGVVLGVLSLKHISTFWLELCLGLFLLIYIIWFYTSARKKQQKVYETRYTLLGWGSLSGLFTGAVCLGGPPLAVCAQWGQWEKNKARAVFGLVFTVDVFATAALDLWHGMITPTVLEHTLAGIPGVVLGTVCGLPLAKRINQHVFQQCLMAIILLGAFSLMFKALVLH